MVAVSFDGRHTLGFVFDLYHSYCTQAKARTHTHPPSLSLSLSLSLHLHLLCSLLSHSLRLSVFGLVNIFKYSDKYVPTYSQECFITRLIENAAANKGLCVLADPVQRDQSRTKEFHILNVHRLFLCSSLSSFPVGNAVPTVGQASSSVGLQRSTGQSQAG